MPVEFSPLSRGLALVAVLVALFLSCSPAHAREAAVKEVVVTNSSSDLLLFCTLADGFTAEMEEGVVNGIPITFTFFVRLEQRRSMLPDREVAAVSFDHTLTYDNLKEEYQVSFSGANGRTGTTSSLGEARRLMSEVNGFHVTSLANLVAEGQYSLSIKVRLAKKTLPLNLQYVVPFLHLWDFETDWYSVRFRY